MSKYELFGAGLVLIMGLSAVPASALCPNCPPPPRNPVEEPATRMELLEVLPDRAPTAEIDRLRGLRAMRAINHRLDPAVQRAAAENADLDRAMGLTDLNAAILPLRIEREGVPVNPCTNTTGACEPGTP